jgi:small subunit ribosomal protein S16
MLVIRFLRTGKKAQPFFRIVVTDKKNPPRGGKFIENLGFVNPLTKEKSVKGERVKYWMSVGAQPSDSVHNLLVEKKIIEGKKIAVHSRTSKKKETTEEAPKDKEASTPVKEETSKEVSEETPKTEEVLEAPVKDKKEEKTEEKKEVAEEVVEEKTEAPEKEEKNEIPAKEEKKEVKETTPEVEEKKEEK